MRLQIPILSLALDVIALGVKGILSTSRGSPLPRNHHFDRLDEPLPSDIAPSDHDNEVLDPEMSVAWKLGDVMVSPICTTLNSRALCQILVTFRRWGHI